MREENYFEKKLEISKDTLAYTISQLDHFDIQIKKLTEVYEYNLEQYNKKVIRLQEIKANMGPRIESLEKKLKLGYTCVDMRTGKAYKSVDARHKAILSQKIKEAEDRYKAMKKAYDLKKRKGEIPKPVVEAPTGEIIESQQERELRLLKEKYNRLEAQRKELELKKKEETELLKVAKELEKEGKAEIIEDIIEEAVDKIEDIIEDVVEDSIDLDSTKEGTELMKVPDSWIMDYFNEEGGKAIWQGRLTNGFKAWCESKGYKIGE